MGGKGEREKRDRLAHPVLEHLSETSRALLRYAHEMAQKYHHAEVSAVHVMGNMGRTDERLANAVLGNFGITDTTIRENIEHIRLPYAENPRDITDGLKRGIIQASRIGTGLGASEISPSHLVEGMLYIRDAQVARMLQRHNVAQSDLHMAMHLVVRGDAFLTAGLAMRPQKRS